MNENKLRREATKALKVAWMFFTVFAIGQICVCIYAIKLLVDYKNGQKIDGIGILVGVTIIIILLGIWEIKEIIVLNKDVKFYANNDVERMRAVVVKVKDYARRPNEATVRCLETGEEVIFQFAGKNLEMDKIYDFIYLKHSKIYEFTPVSFEQLTEDNREKASKIDFNQKD